MKKALTIIFSLFFWNFCIPQNINTIHKIDSVFAIANHKFVLGPLNTDLQSLYMNLYDQSKEIDYSKGKMEALLRIATFKIRTQKDYDKVIIDMNEAEKIALEIANFRGITKSKILRGRAYFFSGLPQYAENELKAALEASKKIENKDNQLLAKVDIYSGYSNYFEHQFSLSNDKIYVDSCIYFLKQKYLQTIQIKKEASKRTKLILFALKSLAGINLTLENYEEVEYYLGLMEQISYLEKARSLKDSLSTTEKKYLQKNYPVVESKLSNTDIILSGSNFNFSLIAGILTIALLAGWYFYKKKGEHVHPVKNYQNLKVKEIVRPSDLIAQTAVLVELASNKDPNFMPTFAKYLPSFIDKLQQINGTLKPDEVEICALIKLNFDTKKIAIVKDCTVRAVESKKYRIRKKLNLSTGDDLHTWMSNIN